MDWIASFLAFLALLVMLMLAHAVMYARTLLNRRGPVQSLFLPLVLLVLTRTVLPYLIVTMNPCCASCLHNLKYHFNLEIKPCTVSVTLAFAHGCLDLKLFVALNHEKSSAGSALDQPDQLCIPEAA